MAAVNWDFAVHQWAKTVTRLAYEQGEEAVDMRCEELPPAFKQRLVAFLRGEDNGGEY